MNLTCNGSEGSSSASSFWQIDAILFLAEKMPTAMLFSSYESASSQLSPKVLGSSES